MLKVKSKPRGMDKTQEHLFRYLQFLKKMGRDIQETGFPQDMKVYNLVRDIGSEVKYNARNPMELNYILNIS